MRLDRGRTHVALLVLVAIKLLAHAIYLPAWEGPDEPFHIGKTLPADQPAAGNGEPRLLQASVAGSVAAHPCSPDLRRVFDCQAFSRSGAFNILSPEDSGPWRTVAVPNYEAHQPPTFYLATGALLGLGQFEDPATALLAVRLLSVIFVMLGLLFVLRTSTSAFIVLALLLLLPGAAESLARASNDSMVFLACAVLMFALATSRDSLVVITVASAPTIKLTAAPFIAAVVVRLWMQGRRKLAVMTTAASLLVIPIQAIRGWAWGGTVEMNQARITFEEPALQSLIGLGRSIYTIGKTTFWLGNWSFFKAPVGLLLVLGAFVILVLASCKPSGTAVSRLSFAAGLAVLAAGIVAFSIAHRSLFGQWGGVGGWYLWGVMPWLVIGLTQNLEVREKLRGPLLFGAVALIVTTNLLWLRSAVEIYGSA